MSVPASVMKEEKFYKPLEAFLTVVNNECIAMEGPDTKRSVEVTLKVLEELIQKMKEANFVFSKIYNRLTYVGSYFDGLRVKEATEFDINVVLKLPLVYEKISVKRDPKFPGFVKVNIKNAKYPAEEKVKRYERETEEIFKWWANADGELSHLKVLRWWESIFSKLSDLSTLTVDGRVFKITAFKKAGPAMTAHISGNDNFGIDVDLVPVIEFPGTMVPPQPIRRELGEWYIVPKRVDGNEYIWRLSFPSQERALMNGKNKLKMVNRFLKRIRDVFGWKPVSSYYIKTIFLWEASIQKDPTFFQKNLGFMLLYFLGKWTSYLERKELPFFWDKNMNLFEKIKEVTMVGYAARLKKLKDLMEKHLQEDNTKELNVLLKTLFKHNGDIITAAKPRAKSTPNDSEGASDVSLSLLIDFDSSEEQNGNSWVDQLQQSLVPLEPNPQSSSDAETATDLFDEALELVKSTNSHAPVNGGTPSANLVTSSVNILTSSANRLTPSLNHVTSSGNNSTSSADEGYSSSAPATSPDSTTPAAVHPQPSTDLQADQEKNMLEIEECKLRLRIAELDLETAKYNLKTAEKRFEMISLQLTALNKTNCFTNN